MNYLKSKLKDETLQVWFSNNCRINAMISLTNGISRLKLTIVRWLEYARKNLIKKKKKHLEMCLIL